MRRIGSLAFATLLLTGACDLGTGQSPTPTSPPTAAPSLIILTSYPTLQPAPPESIAIPSPLASTGTSASADVPQPPGGQLSAGADGDTVDGALGTYCYNSGTGPGACVDSAVWPPATAPMVDTQGAGSSLEFTLADGSEFAAWSAHYYASTGPITLAAAGTSFDPDAISTFGTVDTADFPAPPAGHWTVDVAIRFADGGDAVYAWQVNVTP